MTVLMAIQPFYFPWIGHFAMIEASDICVILDDVQFSRGWQNRNRLANLDERVFWITVPVRREGLGTLVKEARISGASWIERHRKAARACYATLPGFGLVEDLLDQVAVTDGGSLCELNLATTQQVMGLLGIRTHIYKQSDLRPKGRRTEMLISLCRHFGASAYISGPAAKAYLDVKQFAAEGISVEWFEPRAICRRPGPTSIALPLSVLDTLAHFGPSTKRLLGQSS